MCGNLRECAATCGANAPAKNEPTATSLPLSMRGNVRECAAMCGTNANRQNEATNLEKRYIIRPNNHLQQSSIHAAT
jgi:hypothetical protein